MAKKKAVQSFQRGANGVLKITWVDLKTGKPISAKELKNYELLDTTTEQGKELTGQVVNDKGASKTSDDGAKVRDNLRNRRRGGYGKRDALKAGSVGDDLGLFDGNESNNFGFKDKPGFMKLAGLLPGAAGIVGNVIDKGWNAKNVEAINDARRAIGMEPLDTMDTLKDVVKGPTKDVTRGEEKKSIGKKNYGVAIGGVMEDGSTGLTPQESRQRQSLADIQAQVKEALKADLGLHTTYGEQLNNPPDMSTPRPQATFDEPGASRPKGLANLVERYGPNRPNRPNEDITNNVRSAVADILGPDYDVVGTSGKGEYGSFRHRKGDAVDFGVVNTKTGQMATADQMADVAAELASRDEQGATGVGIGPGYMSAAGNLVHADIANPARPDYWGAKNTKRNMPPALAEKIGTAMGPDSFGGFPHYNAPTPTPRPDDSITNMAVADALTPPGDDSLSAVEGYIRDAAIARNIDPDVAMGVAKSEGFGAAGWQSDIEKSPGVRENSFGDFQLNTDKGLGIAYQKATGLDPSDPKNRYSMIDFALDHAAKTKSWGAWYGAARVGIAKTQGLENATPLGLDRGNLTKYSKDYYTSQEQTAKEQRSLGARIGFRAGEDLVDRSLTGTAQDYSPDNMGRSDTPSSGRSGFNRAGSLAGNLSGMGDRSGLGLGSGSSTYGGTRGGDAGRGPGSSAGPGRGTSPGNSGVGAGRGLGLGGPSLGGSSKPDNMGRTDTPSSGKSTFGGGFANVDKDKEKDKDSHAGKAGF